LNKSNNKPHTTKNRSILSHFFGSQIFKNRTKIQNIQKKNKSKSTLEKSDLSKPNRSKIKYAKIKTRKNFKNKKKALK